jgi:hypothetical protein
MLGHVPETNTKGSLHDACRPDPRINAAEATMAALSSKTKRLSGKELIDSFARKFVFSSIGWGLGLLALWQFQLIMQTDDVQAIGKACETLASTDRAEFLETYHDYVPWLGGNIVCFGTQFLHRLVQDSPAGMILWLATWSSWLPALVLVIVEAGRSGAVGPLRFPTIVLLLAQLGISIVFPAIWLLSFVWGRSTHTFKGTVSVKRGTWSRYCIIPGFLLSCAAFMLDPTSYAWSVVVGLLVGPASGLISLVFWNMDAPPEDQATSQMVHAVVTSYSVSGALAFLTWAIVLATVAINYRLDFGLLVKDCWTEAHGFVRLMAIDGILMYAGLLAYIGYVRTSAVAETLVQTIFFGPGAAVAATLAAFELERSPLTTPRGGGAQKKNE